MSEATPVRSACIHVKQLDVAEMSQFGRGLFDHCYRGFIASRSPDDPDVERHLGFLEAITGTETWFDSSTARRFAGDSTLGRSRYHTVCRSSLGDDGGTLLNELRAYYDPFNAGLVAIFDTTVPDSAAKMPRSVAEGLAASVTGSHRPGHLILVVWPMAGKPIPHVSRPVAVALPLKVETVMIERAIDLRDPGTAQWFARTLSTLTWDSSDGDKIPAFPNKCPLSSFSELLPSLLMQALGGGQGATQIAGLWLRKLGVEA
jgi:hypothetical protein